MDSKQVWLGFLSGPFILPNIKAQIDYAAERQEEVIRVCTVLPGNYRYHSVEAAINASGTSPNAIYEALCADKHTDYLERFYEALNGPR